MTDSTTPQDSAAMSPASTGSVEPIVAHTAKTCLLTDAERSLLEMLADHPVTHEIMPNEVATLRCLLERLW